MQLCADIAQRIVERVATGLASQVSIMDMDGQILASTDARLVGQYGGAIGGGSLLAEMVEQPGAGLPLVYADRVVGAILLNDTTPHGREIARVAKTLAELMIHQSMVIEQLAQQKWIRNTFIYDLLLSHMHGSPEVMAQEAAVLGIDLHVPRMVAVITIDSVVERALQAVAPYTNLPAITRALRLEQAYEHVLDQLRQVLVPQADDLFSLVDERRLVMLAAVDPKAPEARRRRLAGEFQQFLGTLARAGTQPASVGLGWYHPGWQALAQSYAEARLAVDTGMVLHGPGSVFYIEELGLAGLVGSDNQALKIDLGQHLLGPLADELELLTTLEAFFCANLSPSQTAKQLHIHRHTLAYRLDKIAQLIGCDPRRFDVAAKLYAALLLRKLGDARPAPAA